MRPAVVKAFSLGMVAGSFLTAGAVMLASPARADGWLDDDELVFVELHGQSICSVIDTYHSLSGVTDVAEAIVDEGFSPDSAVDIVNASVQGFCMRNWPLLQAVGRAYRSANA